MNTATCLTNDAARILNVSPDTVRRLERTGVLPALKTAGGVRLFNRTDVERLALERQGSQEGRNEPVSDRRPGLTA